MGTIPPRWKGVCQNDSDPNFSCNRKLIGARYFKKAYEAVYGKLNSTYDNPRDWQGHGTHTLSTAAGGFVPITNFFNVTNAGTAKGGSPRARVAAYKVCWINFKMDDNCVDADVLAGFDAAIADGVDVISVSLASDPPFLNPFADAIAIGSFRAIRKGISVIASAGNDGPQPGTVANSAPWLFTVAASTLDREWVSHVQLESQRLEGFGLCSTTLPEVKQYPLISSIEAKAYNASKDDAKVCLEGSLDQKKVDGKIVACLKTINGRNEDIVVKKAGGIGLILYNDIINDDEPFNYFFQLPAIHLSYSNGLILLAYINSTKFPTAYIAPPRTRYGHTRAPTMASFSSQGPNPIYPEILKPDITAPGVRVIAAFNDAVIYLPNKQTSPYMILSGTSMACPHIAGVVGLLKALHPNWSPSAIKSAIMTTSTIMDNHQEVIRNSSSFAVTPFSYGSGHVRPNQAMNPGLVYDMTITDYLNFLCSMRYNSSVISLYGPYTCPLNSSLPQDLNYPTITIPNLEKSITITRCVKNVGGPSIYVAFYEAQEVFPLR
ncbi:hypothetical protein HPP92_011303 [Vanilla planifolia]|uniref:Uncharacterized protein n=1 Tax=Vanilla planifolia TaxID=51239 RepID=A0A835V0W5_VANPL|nr:hypothetical protein HPP92_011303 [Vanilla planifolia]